METELQQLIDSLPNDAKLWRTRLRIVREMRRLYQPDVQASMSIGAWKRRHKRLTDELEAAERRAWARLSPAQRETLENCTTRGLADE